MRRFFVYDGVADHPLYEEGYRAAAIGYVKGAKLMFAAEDIGKFVYTTAFADENTKDDKLFGTLWEISNDTYDWIVNELYGSFQLAEGLTFVADDGRETKVDTCYLDGGVFTIPEDYEVDGVRAFYNYYRLDTNHIEKAIEDCEHEVSGGANA